MTRIKLIAILYRLLYVLLAIQIGLMIALLVQTEHLPSRAMFSMGLGLIVMWVLIGGLLMYALRNNICDYVLRLTWDWRITFVLMAILLALIEEAITTTLTNLAPWFGVKLGEAYITASPNYLEVVALHSVVIFIPMFIAWAWLLSRFAFSPAEVLLLFGFTGFLSESMSFGANLLSLPMWIFVYGLLLYLPAYCLPTSRNTRPVKWFHYPLAVLLPVVCAVPVALILMRFHPTPTQFAPLVFP